MFKSVTAVILIMVLFIASISCSFAQDGNVNDDDNSLESYIMVQSSNNFSESFATVNTSNITANQSNNTKNSSSGIYAAENLGNGLNDDLMNPITFDYLKNFLIFSPEELKNLPSHYDLRTLGRVTPVKDQGNIGTCWDFATIGSLESSLLPGKIWNFSENHIKNILSYSYPEGFDRTYKGGGDWLAALAYFARYSGPVLASEDPYNQTSDVSPGSLLPTLHVQETVFLPPRNNSQDNAQHKLAIMKYGAVVSHMCIASGFYDPISHSYYYIGSGSINHDVCLVGWDDNYDKSNFINTPPGNGAFVVRNSWGSDWGDGGYFYISYYDTRLATAGSCAFTNTEPANNYNQVYQYDPYGAVNMTGFTCQTAWFSNFFTANTTNGLAATSFYAMGPNSTYDLSVYLNPNNDNPTSGILAYAKSGVISNPGYKTIRFDDYIPLSMGQVFSVVVKITSPGLTSPLTYEYPLLNYCSRANASFGEGFISSDGKSWLDMAGVITNASVCLKAFTVNTAELLLSQESDKYNPQLGDVIHLTIKVFNQGPGTSYKVVVNDMLPSGLSFISYYATYGTYDPVSGVWSVGDLPSGATATLIIKSLSNQLGNFVNKVNVYSLTFNPHANTSTLSIDIRDTDDVSQLKSVNAKTIPLKNTGTPLLPLIVTLILILGGFLVTSSRRS